MTPSCMLSSSFCWKIASTEVALGAAGTPPRRGAIIGLARQSKGQRLIGGKIFGHQVRKTGGAQQACRNAAGKAGAAASDKGNAAQQGIGCGRMGIVGQGIQHQIGPFDADEERIKAIVEFGKVLEANLTLPIGH